MEMTLSEIASIHGISRRCVQGYETHGLVKATGKTGKGYLLYDETSVKRIVDIKLYQNLGFKLSEVKEFSTFSVKEKIDVLLIKREGLISRKVDATELLVIIDSMIEKLNNP